MWYEECGRKVTPGDNYFPAYLCRSSRFLPGKFLSFDSKGFSFQFPGVFVPLNGGMF
jgi:hypothetical protein